MRWTNAAIVLLISLNYIAAVVSQPIAAPIARPKATVSASASLTVKPSACNFINDSPRYYAVDADLTIYGVDGPYPASDALIRSLQKTLAVDECQLSVTQAQNCNAATSDLPCADPFYLCNGVLVAPSLYDAVKSGECATTPTTLSCLALAQDPSIAQAVNSGSCKAACSSSGAASASTTTPGTSTVADANQTCITVQVTVKVPTQEEATRVTTLFSDAASLAQISNDVKASLNAPDGTWPGYTPTPSAPNPNDLFSGTSKSPAATNTPAPTPKPQTNVNINVVNTDTKPVVGFGFFPPPPSPPPPPPPYAQLEPAINNTEPTLPVVNGSSIAYGNWSSCVPSCGQGISTRTATCFGPAGEILDLKQCPDGVNAQTYKTCTDSPACDGTARWEYGPWTKCSATCGGGTANRTATCVPAGATCDPAQKETTKIKCNNNLCNYGYVWSIKDWGECSSQCGGGNQTRQVTCTDSAGKLADDFKCDAARPVSTQTCNTQPCDNCATNKCLGRGTCVGDTCKCNKGYEGPNCETPSSCKSGVVDSNLQCCPSGLIDTAGTCCPTDAKLDGKGKCCSLGVDACGVCGGTGKFVDMQNKCCTVGDANGMCCLSGTVDECGVCDGVSNTCTTSLVVKMSVDPTLVQGGNIMTTPLNDALLAATTSIGLQPNQAAVTNVWTESSRRRRLAQSSVTQVPVYMKLNVTQTPTSTIPSIDAAYLQGALTAAASTQPAGGAATLVSVPSAERVGVCGNKVCEVGERSVIGGAAGTCPKDCSAPTQSCPGGCGGHGTCMPASGVCECWTGYQGKTCSECASGYEENKFGSACVANIMNLGLVNQTLIDANGAAIVDTADSSSGGLSAGAIAGIAIGCIAGLAALVALFCCWRRRQSANRYPTHSRYDVEGGGVDYLENGTEVSLRQKFTHNAGYDIRASPATDKAGARYSNSNPLFHVQVDSVQQPMHGTQQRQQNGDGGLRGAYSQRPATGGGVQQMHNNYDDGYEQQQQQQQAGPEIIMERWDTHKMPAQAEAHGGDQQHVNNMRASVQSIASSSVGGPYPAESPQIGGGAGGEASRMAAVAASRNNFGVRPPSANDTMGQTHKRLLVSYTSHAMDPDARLFFNPAFSMDDNGHHMMVNSSIACAHHIPKPAPITMPDVLHRRPLSAREDREKTEAKLPLTAREHTRQEIAAEGAGSSAEERRAKLEALRAAVSALEAETGKKRRSEISSATVAFAPPQQQQKQQTEVGRKVAVLNERSRGVSGRPQVPRLQLNAIKPSIKPTRMAAPDNTKKSSHTQQQQQKQQNSGRRHQQQAAGAASDSGSGYIRAVRNDELEGVDSPPKKQQQNLSARGVKAAMPAPALKKADPRYSQVMSMVEGALKTAGNGNSNNTSPVKQVRFGGVH